MDKNAFRLEYTAEPLFGIVCPEKPFGEKVKEEGFRCQASGFRGRYWQLAIP
jgi:hypothetical protein